MNRSAGGAAHPHAPDTKIPNMFSIWLLLNNVVRSYTVNTIIKSVHVSFLVQNRLVHAVKGGPLCGPPINAPCHPLWVCDAAGGTLACRWHTGLCSAAWHRGLCLQTANGKSYRSCRYVTLRGRLSTVTINFISHNKIPWLFQALEN